MTVPERLPDAIVRSGALNDGDVANVRYILTAWRQIGAQLGADQWARSPAICHALAMVADDLANAASDLASARRRG